MRTTRAEGAPVVAATSVEFRRRGARWRRRFCAAAAAGVLALAACGPAPAPSADPTAADGWHEFSGSWTSTGRRHKIPFGPDRYAALLDLSGSLLLAGPARPGIGFGAEAIVLADSAKGIVGRTVWTDQNGDRVYSEIRGDGTRPGDRITGTIVGGTGRYAGATGDYEFTWQFVLEAEDGTVAGRTQGLAGRVRIERAQPAPAARGAKP
jgi:hypothetical protein